MLRAAWFIKISSAYTTGISEAKGKKRAMADPAQGRALHVHTVYDIILTKLSVLRLLQKRWKNLHFLHNKQKLITYSVHGIIGSVTGCLLVYMTNINNSTVT